MEPARIIAPRHGSADAIERKTGICWRRAKKALKTLESAKLIESIKAGARPRYRLALPTESTWIWLPNSLIDGIPGNHSPLEQVRQIGDVMTLWLWIDLYSEQGLRDDGGISWRIVHKRFDRVPVRGERVNDAVRLSAPLTAQGGACPQGAGDVAGTEADASQAGGHHPENDQQPDADTATSVSAGRWAEGADASR